MILSVEWFAWNMSFFTTAEKSDYLVYQTCRSMLCNKKRVNLLNVSSELCFLCLYFIDKQKQTKRSFFFLICFLWQNLKIWILFLLGLAWISRSSRWLSISSTLVGQLHTEMEIWVWVDQCHLHGTYWRCFLSQGEQHNTAECNNRDQARGARYINCMRCNPPKPFRTMCRFETAGAEKQQCTNPNE